MGQQYNRGPRPGWLADQAYLDRLAIRDLRRREIDLLAEIATLRTSTDGEATTQAAEASGDRQTAASRAGEELIPTAIELDLEFAETADK